MIGTQTLARSLTTNPAFKWVLGGAALLAVFALFSQSASAANSPLIGTWRSVDGTTTLAFAPSGDVTLSVPGSEFSRTEKFSVSGNKVTMGKSTQTFSVVGNQLTLTKASGQTTRFTLIGPR